MAFLFKGLIGLAFGLMVTQTALAQDSRYQPWSDPNAPSNATNTETLLQDLDKLINQAERDRAASPGFLSDLRALSAKYKGLPSRRLIFSDRFEDGDFNNSPTWTVTQGRYWIEKDWGLRSNIDHSAPAAAKTEGEQKKLRGEDVAIAVFGAILGAQQGSQTQNRETKVQAESSTAAIHLRQKINNAFEVEMTLSSWQPGGQWEMAVFQGENRQAGYRLVYRSGEPAQLVRFSRRGAQVMGASNRALSLENKKPHQLRWTRNTNGLMSLSHNGETVLSVEDRAFRDAFDGVELINAGGDYIVQGISVWGR